MPPIPTPPITDSCFIHRPSHITCKEGQPMYETSACAFHPFSSEAYVYSMLYVRGRQTDSQTD